VRIGMKAQAVGRQVGVEFANEIQSATAKS
jgi:hypothetical protein